MNMSNRLRTGEWWQATEKDCSAPWYGGNDGEYFRCCFCGYKFTRGNWIRWIYTNDMPEAGGNPLVCERCDCPDIKEAWLKKCRRAETEFWFFTRS